jgi:hypothetical protein
MTAPHCPGCGEEFFHAPRCFYGAGRLDFRAIRELQRARRRVIAIWIFAGAVAIGVALLSVWP